MVDLVSRLLPLVLAWHAGSTSDLDPEAARLLNRWYAEVGSPRPQESFGQLVRRAAQCQVGRPYPRGERRSSWGGEHLRIRLDAFVCTTYVEQTLAVARCVWRDEPTEECFVGEMRELRYRDGVVEYRSRFRYFSDWLGHHADAGRVRLLTPELGGQTIHRAFFHITSNPKRSPAVLLAKNRAAVAAEEQRLSQTLHEFIGQQRIREVEDQLRDGDIFALVGSKPGVLIRHVGFIAVPEPGRTWILHASTRRNRVRLDKFSIASYVKRLRHGIGIVVARPLPASPSGVTHRSGEADGMQIVAALRHAPASPSLRVRSIVRAHGASVDRDRGNAAWPHGSGAMPLLR